MLPVCGLVAPISVRVCLLLSFNTWVHRNERVYVNNVLFLNFRQKRILLKALAWWSSKI